MWMLPLYLHVNQKSDYDMMMMFFVAKYHFQTHSGAKIKKCTISFFYKEILVNAWTSFKTYQNSLFDFSLNS